MPGVEQIESETVLRRLNGFELLCHCLKTQLSFNINLTIRYAHWFCYNAGLVQCFTFIFISVWAIL